MTTARHQGKGPELWFRPSAQCTLEDLLTLVSDGILLATPRLGVRDKSHLKGYVVGESVTLKVITDSQEEMLKRVVIVESLLVKPIDQLTEDDLLGTIFYQGWQAVWHDLARFEKRPVTTDEPVTIVRFNYL